MDEQWTLSELVSEATTRIAALPSPKNGQVRAVPDDRTIRYYGSIGLLDRPVAMRGRTALYGRRHLAQVVAIKRLQTTGRSLAEIQVLWATLDDDSLTRMSGVALAAAHAAKTKAPARREFWKRPPTTDPTDAPKPPPFMPLLEPVDRATPANEPTIAPAEPELYSELRIELAPGMVLSLAVADGISLTPADVRALRAAAAPLVELAQRPLGSHPGGIR